MATRGERLHTGLDKGPILATVKPTVSTTESFGSEETENYHQLMIGMAKLGLVTAVAGSFATFSIAGARGTSIHSYSNVLEKTHTHKHTLAKSFYQLN